MTWLDERDVGRTPGARESSPALGPQGHALIFELRRLQKALEQERDDGPPAFPDDIAAQPSVRPSAKRRGRERPSSKSAFDNAVDLCLGMVGFNRRASRSDAVLARWRSPPVLGRRGEPPQITTGIAGTDAECVTVARFDEVLRMDLPSRGRVLAIGAGTEAARGVVEAGLERLRSGFLFLIARAKGPGATADTSEAELSGPVKRALDGELRMGLRVLIAGVGILGGWATLMPLSGAVVVPGNLVVEANVKKIQHPTGGVVARIPVRDGMLVHAGDLLLALDATQVRANHQVLLKQLDELRVRIARLAAERDGLDQPKPPSEISSRLGAEDVAQLWASELALFAGRAEARRNAKALLRSHVRQLGEQIVGLDAQMKSRTAQRALIVGELEGVESLFQKGLVPLTRKTSLQREAARLDGELGQAASAIAEAKSKISETELQIVRVDQDFRTEVTKDLREAQDKEAELVEKSIAAQDLLNRVDVRAPTAGIVHELSVHTVGGVIAAGEVVMEIIPESSDLQIEARLPPQDIDQVRRGQKTYVRFSAFNQRTTPQLEGVVSYVSADLSRDRQTNAAYYTVRVTLPAEERSRLGPLQLVSGMPAEVFLQTGTRTMMSYLLKPISDQFHRTFSER